MSDPFNLDVPVIPWTHFWDMHSGGGTKLDWEHIFIQAPEFEARRVFQRRFGRDPNNVTCECCGGDYAISEAPSLAQASAYHRGLRHVTRDDQEGRYLEPNEPVPFGFQVRPSYGAKGNGLTLREHIKETCMKIIPASEIAPEDRK